VKIAGLVPVWNKNGSNWLQARCQLDEELPISMWGVPKNQGKNRSMIKVDDDWG